MWFSSLGQFNDPFEARVSVSMDGNDEGWRREFSLPRPSEEMVRTIAAEVEEGIREDAEKIGMFCLSSRTDDMLMWAHYASSHHGLCLGFRTTGESILWDAQPVEYSVDYPLINYFAMTVEQRVRARLLRKAKYWEHEKEWRALRAGPKPGVAHYPSGMLASIILGSEIHPDDRDLVLRAVSVLPVPVDIYQARRSRTAYALILDRLDGATPSKNS